MRHLVSTRQGLRLFTTAAMVVGAVLIVASPALAQPSPPEHDHLKCYQVVRDNHPPQRHVLDLFNLQFGQENNCRLLDRAAWFCAPTVKVRVDGQQETDDPRGPELTSDFVCYRVSCPVQPMRTIGVDDQFGRRQMTIRSPQYFCTPAQKF